MSMPKPSSPSPNQLDLESPSGMAKTFLGLHMALGCLVAWGTGFIIGISPWWSLPFLLVGVGYKEFKWDLDHETKATSGGIAGGRVDFAQWLYGYWGGIGVWYLSLFVRGLIHRL